MKTYILIADINFNDRADIEQMEDNYFESAEDALNSIDQTPDEFYSGAKSHSQCIPLGDFCDLVNDEFYNDSSSWITYVRINTL